MGRKSLRPYSPWEDTPLPEVTDSYMPVGHTELDLIVKEEIVKAGFSFTRSAYKQNKTGERLQGTLHIASGEADFSQTFVFLNSYDKSKAVTCASGAEVFVCSNGMIVSEIVTMRKHTSNVWNDVRDVVTRAVKHMESNLSTLKRDIALLSEVGLTKTQASEFLGRLFIDEGIITSREINEAARQLRNPRFSEFSDLSLWSIYNHCTFAMKESNFENKHLRLKGLHDFSVSYAKDHAAVYGI